MYMNIYFWVWVKIVKHISTNHAPHLVVFNLQARLLAWKVGLGDDSPLHGIGNDEHCDQDQHRDGHRDKDHHQHGDLLCVGLLASIGHD